MTKSKPFLRNSVKPALLLKLCLFISCCLLSSCTSSTKPTYSRNEITQAIENLCQKEYNLYVKAKLSEETLYVYLPVEDILEEVNKPEKYSEKFAVESNHAGIEGGLLKIRYSIKTVPETEKYQTHKYNEKALEKINNVWKVLRRVIFSMERVKSAEPKFFCVITADIKNGLGLKEILYYLDLKKVSYGFISWTEYQHRNIQEVEITPEAIGDKDGLHINYKNITLEDFILSQIAHRIKLKFQKPEVEQTADIDKEVAKIIASTVKIYEFKGFSEVELDNLITKNRVVLSRPEILAKIRD